MTAPISCIPSCCGCVVCELDTYDRATGQDPNAGLPTPIYTGDVASYQIVARAGSDHALRILNDNAFLVFNKDLIVRAAQVTPDHALTREIYVELEGFAVSNNEEFGVVNSYLDAFNWYGAVVHKQNQNAYDFSIVRKSGAGAATVLATISGVTLLTGAQRWVVFKISLQYNTCEMWIRDETGAKTSILSATYTDNNGTKVGVGAGKVQVPIDVDNLKYCEDHCPPITCPSYKDDFERANAPDINDNNSPIVWGYTLPGGRKWQVVNNQAFLQSNTDGTLNAGTDRATGNAVTGTRLQFQITPATPLTKITFGFATLGDFTLTYGSSASGVFATLEKPDASGPTNKARKIKIPLYENQTANINLCLNKDPHYNGMSLKCCVNTNYCISVRATTSGIPAKPWLYSTHLGVSGNLSGAGVYVNNYHVSGTLDDGTAGGPACTKCDPMPCDICEVSLPDSTRGGALNICGLRYTGTFTNGVLTNPASGHVIQCDIAQVFGYIRFVYQWTPSAGDEIIIYLTNGMFLKIHDFGAYNVTGRNQCMYLYYHAVIQQMVMVNMKGVGNYRAFELILTDYGLYVLLDGALVLSTHQIDGLPVVTYDVSVQINFTLGASSYFLIDTIRFGRAATGLLGTNIPSPTSVPECYSQPESCGDITRLGSYYDIPVVNDCNATIVGEWWTLVTQDPPSSPPGKPGSYGFSTWSANAKYTFSAHDTDYPISLPSVVTGQAGAFMDWNFTANGQGINANGWSNGAELRVTWNNWAGYLQIKQLPWLTYLADQPQCATGYHTWRLTSVGLGLAATSIDFQTSTNRLRICIGGGRLFVTTGNTCFPVQTLIDTSYGGQVTGWGVGTGFVDPTEQQPGVSASRDWVGHILSVSYQYLTTPLNVYEQPPPVLDCVDCNNPRPFSICPTRGAQNKAMKVVCTGTRVNNQPWANPNCGAAPNDITSCNWYNRISLLNNQNVQYTYNEFNEANFLLYCLYHPFGDVYPPVDPNRNCRNRVAEIRVQIWVKDPNDPTLDTISVSFTGVGQGPSSSWGQGEFFLQEPTGTRNFCQPFGPITIPWNTFVYPLPFPPPAAPGPGGQSAYGCDMSHCTVTIQGF